VEHGQRLSLPDPFKLRRPEGRAGEIDHGHVAGRDDLYAAADANREACAVKIDQIAALLLA
jgi:hypothetical protein